MYSNEFDIHPLSLPWDQIGISKQLSITQQRVEKTIGPENKRQITGQITVVKTINAPHLLSRYLTSFFETESKTSFQGIIKAGVIDDSQDPAIRMINRNIAQEISLKYGRSVDILESRSDGSENLIGRLRNKILDLAENENWSKNAKRKALLALQTLLTERFNITTPDLNPDDRSIEYLDNHYSNLGGGAKATANLATLLGNYIMGKADLVPVNALCTYNDDDVIVGTMAVQDGIPIFEGYDFFEERNLLAKDPETVFIAGKYVGTTGNPVALLTKALETTSEIIQYLELDHQPNEKTSFYISEEGYCHFLTTTELTVALPTIINQFLARTPVTGFKLPQNYQDLWIFDLGNYTLTGEFSREFPFPTTGVGEFIVTGIMKTKFRNQDKKRKMVMEKPILHLRSEKLAEHNIYPGSLITSMTTSHISVDQRTLEAILYLNPARIHQKLIDFFKDDEITGRLILEEMPTIKAVRGKSAEMMEKYRKKIELYLTELEAENDAGPLVSAIRNLIEEVSDNNLKEINKTRNPNEDMAEKSLKYLNRFLEASKYWKLFCQLSWQLGQDDNQLQRTI